MKATKKNFIFWKDVKTALRKDIVDNFDTITISKYLIANKAEKKAYKLYLKNKTS